MSAPRPRLPAAPEPERGVEWVPVPTVIDANGDKIVTLYDERGRAHPRLVAELILETFVGPCPPGQELRFKDGDRLNCELANLEWANAVAPGATIASRPATVRPIRTDPEGRLVAEDDEVVNMPGLSREDVLAGLADLEAGRLRPLRDIQAGRRPCATKSS